MMQPGDIVAAIDLGTSRTAYAYTVVGREHIWLGVPDSPDDDRNASLRFFCLSFCHGLCQISSDLSPLSILIQ